jgi:hypothetical protein
MKNKIFGICNLCKKEKELVESHIIPDFFYYEMKKGNENIPFLSVNYEIGKLKEGITKKSQKGDTDKNILCANCDNVLIGEKLEKYAKNFLFGSKYPTNENLEFKNLINPKNGSTYFVCKNYDYTKFKNFLLSILWRASVSSNKLFKNVNLGEKHNENLRNIILNNVETDFLSYPIILNSFYETRNNMKNVILQPQKEKLIGGINVYIMILYGLQITYLINSENHKIPEKFYNYIISKEELIISHYNNVEAINLLKNFI